MVYSLNLRRAEDGRDQPLAIKAENYITALPALFGINMYQLFQKR
jgi:hypothetical protein